MAADTNRSAPDSPEFSVAQPIQTIWLQPPKHPGTRANHIDISAAAEYDRALPGWFQSSWR
ncbi:MAG TPA: hypothetical protein IGS52_20200 [Oscillatoriaceae cyanobacterium M33_DOE_052]|uniref:Uncharacterized protein n=1 Tax=Planktothricoides sp. SpSt-374 TaxID=2282167 RepID=A0A7C3ZY17_9CYAN|nr:hypothetical protein [Oscillatoriaceae cyanobacterium M33_DOE_052]